MDFHIIQDRAIFYSVKSGYIVYTAPVKVINFKTSEKARRLFKKWFTINHPAFTLIYDGM